MLHNTGPFGPNEAPVNVNPQSNMTSMSGRMNIGNNINNLPKLPQQSPQPLNTHFNLPEYPAYGLNMNPSLSPFQNFHHVGFQQNSMSQSAIHENWQNNMLPMNLNMQGDHHMLGFTQYGKPDLSEQSYNKSMLNVPQVHTKAFHKQMGMDINYQYNLNPSYRPYMDYNLGLTSKHKTDDLRQFIDQNLDKDRIVSSPQYMEQIDLSNKHKMHSFTRSYLDSATTKNLHESSNVNMHSNISALASKRRDKPTYSDGSDALKSQINLENRYIGSQLDLSKPQKPENLNLNFQNMNTDLRYYKDQSTRSQNLDMSVSKTQKPDILSTSFQNASSDLRIYKEQDSRPSYEKMLPKPQLSENFNTNYQNVTSDFRYYKDKHLRPESSEISLSKGQKPENTNTIYPNNSNFININSNLKYYKDKSFKPESLDRNLCESQKPENLITNFANDTNFQSVSTDLRYLKDKSLRNESLENPLLKSQKPENVTTNFTNEANFQNINTDVRYYKDSNLGPEIVESDLSKTQKPDNLSVNFANVSPDLKNYKDQDPRPQSLEKIFLKSQQPEKLDLNYQNTDSEDSKLPRPPENTTNDLHSSKTLDPNFSNINSDLQSSTQEAKEQEQRVQINENALLKPKQAENVISNYPNYSSELRFYKDQDSRRRSLENTVKMIENILSHSSNTRKSHLNLNQQKSSQDLNTKEKYKADTNETNENTEHGCNKNKNNDINTVDSTSIDNTSNSFNKTDDSDANTSNEMDNDNAISNDEMDIDNQTTDESDMDDENKDDSIDQSLKKLQKTINKKTDKQVAEELRSDMSSDEEVQSKKVSKEIVHSETKIDNSVVVKVEVVPTIVDMEHFNPFHRDSFGVQREDTTNHDIIDSETSITVAKEVVRNGASVQGAYFECPHCNLYFNQPKRFIIHTKWHSFGLTNEKRMELQKEKEMRKHMRKEARVVERMMQTEVTDANAPGRKFNCRDCDKVFNAKASLKNHRQRYHPTRARNCKICGKTVLGWMALRTHMATHTCESGYQCDDCPKRFKHPHSLAKHRDTHLEKTQACPQCPKKFGSVTLLNVHMKTHERALRGATFRCTYCGKGFFESYSLQVHERTHRNERPYLCEICNTSFGTNSSLKRHLKVSHSSTKPYECTTCHRSFISEAIRDRHTMRNHGNPEDFKFMCKQCPCKYLKLKDLRKHMYKVHPKGKRKKKVHSDSE